MLERSGDDTISELIFPTSGKHTGFPAGKQPGGTSRSMNNMRPYFDGKAVGGQRPGLDKWGAGVQIGAAEQPVVAMTTVSSIA
ncbi:hypothetical protein LCGC14_1230240 [marine sediment metagenome]|uniref:Uncharacterized protein n=1 Tax=marine sediment metagenome TaxID=412755 RepID=A0A0F9PD64_9ZZZZ